MTKLQRSNVLTDEKIEVVYAKPILNHKEKITLKTVYEQPLHHISSRSRGNECIVTACFAFVDDATYTLPTSFAVIGDDSNSLTVYSDDLFNNTSIPIKIQKSTQDLLSKKSLPVIPSDIDAYIAELISLLGDNNEIRLSDNRGTDLLNQIFMQLSNGDFLLCAVKESTNIWRYSRRLSAINNCNIFKDEHIVKSLSKTSRFLHGLVTGTFPVLEVSASAYAYIITKLELEVLTQELIDENR